MISRREFLATTGAAVAVSGAAGTIGAEELSSAAAAAAGQKSSALFLPDKGPQPATFDRLPLEWHQQRAQKLRDKLAENGYEGILLTNRWNIIYFTGLWHTTTERMVNVFLPVKGEPVWFYAALDRDLVKTWWYKDGEMYFDWPHAEGAFPNEGKVQMGARVDLADWMLKALRKRGYADRKLAADTEFTPSMQRKVVNVLGKEMASADEYCIGMRMRKTPEELALMRRSYNYFNQMHAFARDFLLEHGTNVTDFDIASAATKYGTDLVMADIKHDGMPHTAVGITVSLGCRVGPSTASPHPNQFLYNKVSKGQAIQIEGGVNIAGCGGELYRAMFIHPMTDQMKKLWTVSRDCCLMQKEESIAGITCSTVAYKIHSYQVKNGVAPYIYHRPAHGQGWEGHQPPYLALGDYTMLDPGMCFSVEPGLYDPEHGIGSNFSDVFVVQPEGPSLQMSRLPWSEDWCWVKL
ncbi:MAG TPA: M24 family metallopeptidase [Candidatus Acidoferrales bacterium]|nr:M24 family metallopeptidase [Candidatus Acidoferrales bacterium]